MPARRALIFQEAQGAHDLIAHLARFDDLVERTGGGGLIRRGEFIGVFRRGKGSQHGSSVPWESDTGKPDFATLTECAQVSVPTAQHGIAECDREQLRSEFFDADFEQPGRSSDRRKHHLQTNSLRPIHLEKTKR